jgi:tetratricopeptide (TPR) repeat protein
MRPLPAVLLDLHDDLSTGKLTLRRGRVNKSVDLVNGNPVSTTSTPRDETLGHFLVSSGVISEEAHRQAVGRATEIGSKLGEALVALRYLTVEQLIDQLGKQARHKLVQALRWPQGAWRFDETFDPIEGMQLRMVEVVLGGLRETAVEGAERLGRLDGMTFQLTERGLRLRHEIKRTFSSALAAALEQRASMGDVERAMGNRAQARIAIDALVQCDAITTAAPKSASGSHTPPVPTLPIATGRVATRQATQPAVALYDMLFDDLGGSGEGAAPLDFPEGQDPNAREDSGVVSTAELVAAASGRDLTAAARQAIAAEHARVKAGDHYAVLLVGHKATGEELAAGFTARATQLQTDGELITDLLDKAKIVDISAAYAAARAVLQDPTKRAAYDRELAGGELVQARPAIDTELGFRMAEDLMAKKQWEQAIGHIRTVLVRSPGEADYHAALGWAEWHAAGNTAEAADGARNHINHALAIDPDHARAHDYKGRIDALLHSDEAEALFHLERAIDLDPARGEALTTIEGILTQRGELRRLERLLKRHLFRLRGKGGALEANGWMRLARLQLDHLDDTPGAITAAANAKRLAPRDADAAALVARAEAKRVSVVPVREGWREALADPASGAELVRTTVASGHADAAFLAAATMVALGTADPAMAELYEQHRVKAALAVAKPLGLEQWALLRHKDDTLELGALLELVAPAVHALAPMTLADAELDPSTALADGDLPAAFGKLRARFSMLLGVPLSAVYPRVELGTQIHVVACDPPVLVAGDDALTSPERPDLAFRIARAMTFLPPGRAVGASRPGRTLRAVVLAMVREASGSEVGLDESLAPAATAAIQALPAEVRAAARAAALRVLSTSGGGLNLSVWSRALARTADRAGMLLCGDVPAAIAGAKESADLDRDLIEFSYSAAHVKLRGQLGITR